MKRRPITPLVAQQLLVGRVRSITAMDFRRSPGEFLTQVQMGATFHITKNGHPVATLTGYQFAQAREANALRDEVEGLRSFKRSVDEALNSGDGGKP